MVAEEQAEAPAYAMVAELTTVKSSPRRPIFRRGRKATVWHLATILPTRELSAATICGEPISISLPPRPFEGWDTVQRCPRCEARFGSEGQDQS